MTSEPQWHQQLLGSDVKRGVRQWSLSLSEVMTILISFHRSYYRTFKHYYPHQVCHYCHSAFPKLVSNQRFVVWTPSCIRRSAAT